MRPARLEVLFSPAEFDALKSDRLRMATCVVFDVLRATSSMVAALAAGAEAILPVAKLHEALEERRRWPRALLAGERAGLRIDARQTGGTEFHFGNSPREFRSPKVRGKRLIWTTTNGTRALRAVSAARRVFACSFLNLAATAARLRRLRPRVLLLICAGTYQEAAWEDTLAAGGLCQALGHLYPPADTSDSALLARSLFLQFRSDLPGALALGRNGRRLLGRPEWAGDVPFAARRNAFPWIVELGTDGWLRGRPRRGSRRAHGFVRTSS